MATRTPARASQHGGEADRAQAPHAPNELLLTAGLSNIGGHEYAAIHDVEGCPGFPVVILAQRDNVPTFVGGAVLLDMGTDLRAFIANSLPAGARERLPTELLPMI